MFCIPSDFNQLPYAIPNLGLVINTFQNYINSHEKSALVRLLGVELYYDFIEGLEDLPPLWDQATDYGPGDVVTYGNDIFTALDNNGGYPPDINPALWELTEEGNKWLKLKNGFIFTYQDSCCSADHSTEWLGVASMLKPFIFYSWLRDTWDNYSGIGVVQGKAENAEVIAPARRLTDAYNDYAAQATVMLNFINTEAYLDPLVYNTCSCWPGQFPGMMNTFNL